MILIFLNDNSEINLKFRNSNSNWKKIKPSNFALCLFNWSSDSYNAGSWNSVTFVVTSKEAVFT